MCERYARPTSDAPTSAAKGPRPTGSPSRAAVRTCHLGANEALCSARGVCDSQSGVCLCHADGVDSACGCPIGSNGASCSAHGRCDGYSGTCLCTDGFGGRECSLNRNASTVADWYAATRGSSSSVGAVVASGVAVSTATRIEIQCTPGCAPQWLGDSVCDFVCGVPECSNDHGDCLSSRPSDVPNCPCPLLWIGDGLCDAYCGSVEKCQLDEGDCGRSANMATRSMPVDVPPGSAHNAALPKPMATTSMAARCAPLCDPLLVGDGSVCDTGCNTPECGYDAGDCARGCMPGCFDFYRGDGFCDDICNVEMCDYDDGDCASASDQPAREVEELKFDGLQAELMVGGTVRAQVCKSNILGPSADDTCRCFDAHRLHGDAANLL